MLNQRVSVTFMLSKLWTHILGLKVFQKNLINCIFWSKNGTLCYAYVLCVLLYSWIAVYSRNPNLKFKNWFRHIVALSLGCKNKHWSQFFYFIYRPCIVVQAGQKLMNSLNFHGRNKFKFVKAVLDEVRFTLLLFSKISFSYEFFLNNSIVRLKHCDHQFL